MSAAALIRRAHEAHIDITVTPVGTIKISGPADSIAALTPELRASKPELLAHLLAANDVEHPKPPPARVRLHLTVETDGKNKGVTMLGAIGQTRDQAIESARDRFGDRLINAGEELS